MMLFEWDACACKVHSPLLFFLLSALPWISDIVS